MGIRGLTTFVDQNAHEILLEENLSDETIVIDGWNICHWIFSRAYNIPRWFNGDYYEFALSVKAFFLSLMECNVQSVVILDASDIDKERASLQFERAKDRVKAQGMSGNPILAEAVFLKVLRELNVSYSATPNTDREIAAMARKLNGYVLTNDSDFFVYDLPKGVILLDYLDCRVVEIDNCQCLKAQVFRQENFVSFLKMRCSEGIDIANNKCLINMLPLLAAAIDYPELVSRLKTMKGSKSSSLSRGPVAAAFRVLLVSSLDQDPWESALERFCIRMPIEFRQGFMKSANCIRKGYNCTDLTGPICENNAILNRLMLNYDLSRMMSGDAIVHHRVLLKCLIEISELPSCYDSCKLLRLELYSLLFKNATHIMEFNRKGMIFVGEEILVTPSDQHFQDLRISTMEKKLETLTAMLTGKKDLIFRSIYEKYAQSGSLFHLVTVAWLSKLLPKFPLISENFILAFALSSALVNIDKKTEQVDFEQLLKHFNSVQFDKRQRSAVNHIFACWQPICFTALDIAALFDLPDNQSIGTAEYFYGSILVWVTFILLKNDFDSREKRVEFVTSAFISKVSDEPRLLETIDKLFRAEFEFLISNFELISEPDCSETPPELSNLLSELNRSENVKDSSKVDKKKRKR